MNVTRRNMARMLAATTAIPVLAVSAAPVSDAAQAPADADEETRSAHDLMRSNAQALANVKLPMAAEPAVHFKA
jgi:hypothetical protein